MSSSVSRKWPRWFVPNRRSNPSSVFACGHIPTPALLTKISIWGNFSKSVCAHSRTDFNDARLSCSTFTTFPDCCPMSLAAAEAFSGLRQRIVTLAPRLLKSRAVSFPIPVLAPWIETNLNKERSISNRAQFTNLLWLQFSHLISWDSWILSWKAWLFCLYFCFLFLAADYLWIEIGVMTY